MAEFDFGNSNYKNKNMPTDMVQQAALVNQTYSYINNVGFYAIANPTYYDYYTRVIRQCSQWLDGYVYQFHNIERGFFSTRLASTLVNGIGNHIVGQKIFFEKGNDQTEKDVIDFITRWSKKSNFQSAVRNAIKMATGLGTSLLKINKSKNGLWLEDVRIDYFFFEQEASGKLTDVTTMIKGYYNVNHSKDNKLQQNYYLVEHRYFEPVFAPRYKEIDGKKVWNKRTKVGRTPMVEYNVYRYTGNTMSAQTYVPKGSERMEFNSLPKQVRNSLRDNYSILKLNEPQLLPFSDYLGCELLKNDDKDITLPNTPFGRPMLLDIQSDLMAYDMAFSYMVRDLYLGKGSVLVPKGMTAPNQQTQVDSPFNGTDTAFFQAYSSVDPDKQKPQPIQFDLRTKEWVETKEHILREIATKIGMSPKTIASYLEGNESTRKTATEVNAEDDATISYISIKRSIYEQPLNRIIDYVLGYYGKVGYVTIKFATPSLVNMDKIVDRVVKLKGVNLISDKMALQMIFPDDDEDQIKAKLEELEEFNGLNNAVKVQEPQII